jgi:hypothetical protein
MPFYLYRSVLKIDRIIPIYVLRAKRSEHLPTVLSKEEIAQVLSEVQGSFQLIAKFLPIRLSLFRWIGRNF